MKLRNPYARINDEVRHCDWLRAAVSFDEVYGGLCVENPLMPTLSQLRGLTRELCERLGFKRLSDEWIPPEAENIAIGALLNVCRKASPTDRDHFARLYWKKLKQRLKEHLKYDNNCMTYLDPVVRRERDGTKAKPKRLKIELTDDLPDVACPEPEPESETLSIMSDFIEQLSEDDPEFALFYELRYVKGMTVEKCADIMGRRDNYLSKKFGSAALKRLFLDIMGAETYDELSKNKKNPK